MTSEAFPLVLTTGRTVYHFHTRTKTARAPQLEAAAPDVWVEVTVDDAAALGLREGDRARVGSPRGALEAPVRVGRIRPEIVFVPFHYGSWDRENGPPRAANELTLTSWDPVSKQPFFKVAAVRVSKVADGAGRPAPSPTVGGSAPADPEEIPATAGGPAAEASSR